MITDFTFAQILTNLAYACAWTLALSFVAFSGGSIVGTVVLLCRVSKIRVLRMGSKLFIRIFQSTPLLMQLFLAFFGLALLGLDVPAWLAAGLALTMWTAAFLAEIWRGCVDAVPKGQWESSGSLAMTFLQQMRYVIGPQAFKIAIPPTVGFLVQVVKATSLTSIIGFVELSRSSSMIANATFQPFTVFGLAALLYFCMCWPLSLYSQRLERTQHVPS